MSAGCGSSDSLQGMCCSGSRDCSSSCASAPTDGVAPVEQPKASRADMVEHPPHYRAHPSGVECIEITRHMNFNLGNATKYIWRAGLKGEALEDLRKAAWYIADEIARIEGGNGDQR